MDAIDSAQPAEGLPVEGPAARPLKIFVNYRREDMPYAASTLYGALKERFDAENIFFDQGPALRAGMQFPEEITSYLTKTPGVFLALIGPRWLEVMTARRARRDDDWVVREIDLAFQSRWTIIPVLTDDARLPRPSELPPAVRELPDCQAAYLRQANLDDDVEKLSDRLGEIRVDLNDQDPAKTRAQQQPSVPAEVVTERSDRAEPAKDPDVFPADDAHYQRLFDEIYNNNLIIFLGAGVNAEDYGRPFRLGASMLPDDSDVAAYLARMARRESQDRRLAEIAQYARIVSGEPNVFKWVRQTLQGGTNPGRVHTDLAHLPGLLKELGLEKRYQMIVTPKFDVALEQAFRKEREPFDVAVYMAPGTEYAGKFVHLPWLSPDPQPVLTNDYQDFPFTSEGELLRTVIVRINGAVDDIKQGYRWGENFVITEDHYIDYLHGRSAEQVVPVQILGKLRQASCLFLGYPVADWRLRVFLHWIWPGEMLGRATHWAVERDPDDFEREFWKNSRVSLYQGRLTDYVKGFYAFLQNNIDDLKEHLDELG